MSFFPFFKDIEGAHGLIVGGGAVALRKAEKLLPYGPKLTVIAPEISNEFYEMDITIINRAFRDSDIADAPDFVISACDDEAENRRISLMCQQKGIPVNTVDRPELCTFLFPSLIKNGDLTVGISTSGSSPSAAAWLKGEVEKLIPDNMEQILHELRIQREYAKKNIACREQRSRYLKECFVREMNNSFKSSNSSNEEKQGTVSLVGAGCGSKEWITLEGLNLLRECDAVVYDDLIDKSLLDEVPADAEKIYVGKRSHKPSARQEDIKEVLIELAKQNKHTVRLKGGDPFVFGRGGEEIQALNKNNIPWKVVPGISSALAIPAEAGIPVTYRSISRSIHILTAHTKENILRRDLEQLAKLEGTLVVLMGLESLADIADAMKENGRDKNTPVAVLSGGNTEHPYKVIGTLDNITEKAEAENATTPAVIVIGDVVSLDLHNDAKGPLTDISIGLTGTDDFQAKLRRQLMIMGAEPVSLMHGRCMDTTCVIPWNKITDETHKWLVFTSVQGVRTFFRSRKANKIDNRRFFNCKFAVIGPATGQELEKYGFTADLCPAKYTTCALADALLSQMEDEEQIYLFCSKQGSALLTNRLEKRQIKCHRLDIYETFFSCTKEYTSQGADPEYILLGSAGGVNALHKSGYRPGNKTTGICIGPVCADAYRRRFGTEPITAKEATAEALIAALTEKVTEKEGEHK